ncbi:nicotinate-nucleotide--dimethylbenzimidazole phosphoribosyltransferase [Chloroflexota bacterium]
MMKSKLALNKLVEKIKPIDLNAFQAAEERQNILTKPPGSLGKLEEISIKLAGITGEVTPKIEKKAVVVMAGDHGVVAEGVSAYPSEVTPQMVMNMLGGGAAINVLANYIGADVLLVDIGVEFDFEPTPGLIDKKVRKGTSNIASGPAMSEEETLQAIFAGVSVIEQKISEGLHLVATGDMGIGNTTPSAAIASAITGKPAFEIVGRGTGVDDEGLKHKISVVERAIEINEVDKEDGLDVLAKVGGFEIGGLTGVILGAAANGVPVVVDGFISTAAAMIAVVICPLVKDYLFAGHCSQELGHKIMLESLELDPILDLDFRLGEGTGAVLAMCVIEAASRVISEMATFSEAGVSDKED